MRFATRVRKIERRTRAVRSGKIVSRGRCCTDRRVGHGASQLRSGHTMRTEIGRPYPDMRFRTVAATATSVARSFGEVPGGIGQRAPKIPRLIPLSAITAIIASRRVDEGGQHGHVFGSSAPYDPTACVSEGGSFRMATIRSIFFIIWSEIEVYSTILSIEPSSAVRSSSSALSL